MARERLRSILNQCAVLMLQLFLEDVHANMLACVGRMADTHTSSRSRGAVGPRRLSDCLIQALSARTAGRSAAVGSRRALAGTVTTATVLPVMSKNSTE